MLKKKLVVAGLVSSLIASSAWAAEPVPSWKGQVGKDAPSFELANPGYFDVGGGFAYIDQANYLGQSATGWMVSIKAYPKGRWYAPRRKVDPLQVAQKLNSAATAQAQPATASDGTPTVAAKTMADATQALSDYLENQKELFQVVAPESATGSRWSVFYGRSLGNFDNTTIKGNVDALGVAFDIAPECALVFGVAFYQADLANGSFETKHKPIIGIQMNLNAFSALRGLGN